MYMELYRFNRSKIKEQSKQEEHRDARPSAVAKPMPEFAPVTMQFFPSIPVCISSNLNFFACSLQK